MTCPHCGQDVLPGQRCSCRDPLGDTVVAVGRAASTGPTAVSAITDSATDAEATCLSELREVCRTAGEALNAMPIDVAFVGIGENGHLAFNDPPADFITDEPYLVVQLDEACRRQQVGEGWFGSAADVPASAISMSVRQILKSREIICVVPDARKAAPVKATLEGPITPDVPASALCAGTAT